MKIYNYSEFLKDILSLYCKTGHRGIEDIFIRLSDEDFSKFDQWMIGNQKNSKLKDRLQDPIVFDALIFLINLKKQYPFGVNISDITKDLIGTAQASYIPYIISFNSLLDDPLLQKILGRFRHIIPLFSRFTIKGGIDLQSIKGDLYSIISFFNAGRTEPEVSTSYRQTAKQKKEGMFLYLLQRFSDELASASDQNGLPELASEFRAKILSKPLPYGLGKHFSFKQISNQQFLLAQKVAKDVLKNYESNFNNYNHDLVDTAFLHSAGVLSTQDIIDLRESFEQKKDVYKIMTEKEDYPGMDIDNKIPMDKRLNLDYLYMLSLFFTFMQRELNIPSMTYSYR